MASQPWVSYTCRYRDGTNFIRVDPYCFVQVDTTWTGREFKRFLRETFDWCFPCYISDGFLLLKRCGARLKIMSDEDGLLNEKSIPSHFEVIFRPLDAPAPAFICPHIPMPPIRPVKYDGLMQTRHSEQWPVAFSCCYPNGCVFEFGTDICVADLDYDSTVRDLKYHARERYKYRYERYPIEALCVYENRPTPRTYLREDEAIRTEERRVFTVVWTALGPDAIIADSEGILGFRGVSIHPEVSIRGIITCTNPAGTVDTPP